MIAGIFKSKQPVAILLLPAFAIGIFTIAFFNVAPPVVELPMPFYSMIQSGISQMPPVLSFVIACLLVISQAWHLNTVVNNREVLYKTSYLPALFYVVFCSIIPSFMGLHPVLVVQSIMIFALDKIFKLYKHPAPLPLCFDIGFLISLASLVYFPSFAYFLFFAVSLVILRPFELRTWVTAILGLAAPWFFTAFYFFMSDSLNVFENILSQFRVEQKPDLSAIDVQGITTTLIVISLCLAAALLKLRGNFYKNVIRTRSFQWIILILLLFTLGVPLFSLDKDLYEFSMASIPLSVLIAYFFLAVKREWLTESLFVILLVLLVFNLLRA